MRPSPICPTCTRLLEPKARDGTNMGATAAPAAVSIFRWVIMAESVRWKEGRKEGASIRAPPCYGRAGRAAPSRRTTRAPLLVTERVDGVQPRGLACRVQAENDTHTGAHRQRDEHDLGLGLH